MADLDELDAEDLIEQMDKIRLSIENLEKSVDEISMGIERLWTKANKGFIDGLVNKRRSKEISTRDF